MQYSEEKTATDKYKKSYVDGFYRIIKKRQTEAHKKRDEYIKDIFKTPEKYREDFKEMLGWPLVDYNSGGLPSVKMTELSREDGYTIYRAELEVMEGLTLTGLFYKAGGVKPVVIVQHGKLGTPELVSGMYGDTYNYNNMLHRIRENDVHIFAPQLLLWSEDYGAEYDRDLIDSYLKGVGGSVTAVEVFCITRVLDYFEAQEYVSCFGMAGLSYGGFYTLCVSAVDTRIRSAISCAVFNTRENALWPDWTWHNSWERFDDAEIACLTYPRRLCLEIGNRDETFPCEIGIKSFERLKRLSEGVGTDWVDLIVFDGAHEFNTDDEPIKKMINDLR